MATLAQAEPRRHHYVPRCWLAGFTDTGEPDGRLFVTDFKRGKQWGAVPGTAGFIRDFYRLEDESASDPVVVEKAFSRIEDAIAPILRTLYRSKCGPTVEELDYLLNFIAIQWSRVPAFRPFALDLFDRISYERLDEILKSPESLRRALLDADMDPDAPGAEYERMKKFHDDKAYIMSAPTDWYVLEAFKAAQTVMPGLRKRYWTPLVSPSGGFIASDNPVILEGPKGTLAGFENTELISFAVNRHLVLWGTLRPIRQELVNRKFIARGNTLSLLRANEQVFSNSPDFCWLDENEKYQTDWNLFSKSKY